LNDFKLCFKNRAISINFFILVFLVVVTYLQIRGSHKTRGVVGKRRNSVTTFFHGNLTRRCVFLLRFPVCSSRRRFN